MNILFIMLSIHLIASVAASLFITLCDNPHLTRPIIRNRYGLLLMELRLKNSTFVIWSPFTNACDVFLLIVRWNGHFRFSSDVFRYYPY